MNSHGGINKSMATIIFSCVTCNCICQNCLLERLFLRWICAQYKFTYMVNIGKASSVCSYICINIYQVHLKFLLAIGSRFVLKLKKSKCFEIKHA